MEAQSEAGEAAESARLSVVDAVAEEGRATDRVVVERARALVDLRKEDGLALSTPAMQAVVGRAPADEAVEVEGRREVVDSVGLA